MYRVLFLHRQRAFLFSLEGPRHTLGRGEEASLRLPVPEVSRCHAELERVDGRWKVRDLASRNGVYVQGKRVEEAMLPPLVEFSLGPVVGRIEEVSASEVEMGLELHGLARSVTVGGDSDATATQDGVPGAQLAARVLAPTAAELRRGAGLGGLARRGGGRLTALYPGMALRVEHGADVVLFAGGELPRRSFTARRDDLTVRWQPPEEGDGFAVRQGVEALLALLAAATAQAPASTAPGSESAAVESRESGDMIAASPPMRQLLAYARRLAPTSIHLLILGPTGAGKELLARHVHDLSPRRDGPFVALDCAALPRDLLAAELFGIEKKVATGVSGRAGRFEQADGGTLFLDEVCDMAPETQATMLRVLQEKRFYRLGGRELRDADVRLLAATNKDVAAEIAAGRFRADLYYRLAGDTLRLPPLAERPGDVPLLLHHFLDRFARETSRPVSGVSKKALELLSGYAWPGNVRQLENEVRRLVALAPESGLIETMHLSPTIRDGRAPGSVPRDRGLVEALARLERRMIEEALAACEGKVAAAARRLGISRPGLHQRMKRLGIGADRW